jgi:transposase
MSTENLFADALGIKAPWFVEHVELSTENEGRRLEIKVNFSRGCQFTAAGRDGVHPVHDTVRKEYRSTDFFDIPCHIVCRIPRVKLPDGRVRMHQPEWAGMVSGFSKLFEAIAVMLLESMTIKGVAKTMRISWHQTREIARKYVNEAESKADLSKVTSVAIDETSKKRGHKYVTIVADPEERKVIFVTEGRDAEAVVSFSDHLKERNASPDQITSVSIDMSGAFIKGVQDNLPNARITFDKFHVIQHAKDAIDETRRSEQKSDPSLKGTRWLLLKNRSDLNKAQQADLDGLVKQATSKATARAWLYCEQLRDIMDRKQIYVVTRMLKKWCSNVLRSKVEAMKKVARMILSHFEGVVAWAQTRQTNGFLEAINGLFQAAKRQARGFSNFETIRIVIFLRSGKLDLKSLNKHIRI